MINAQYVLGSAGVDEAGKHYAADLPIGRVEGKARVVVLLNLQEGIGLVCAAQMVDSDLFHPVQDPSAVHVVVEHSILPGRCPQVVGIVALEVPFVPS